MIRKVIVYLKSALTEITDRFRSEELFFGISAISSVIIDYGSILPSLFVCGLLAFYYLFFGWYMFSTKMEKHVFFSIFAGIIYSICLLSIMALIAGVIYQVFFYILQLLILVSLLFVLKNKSWGTYKDNHQVRVIVLLLLNVYVCIFR